ncbi:MFS transporter [Glutamicibacter halophytocola]|uniref:MFS transporter n=1 Tax=Glutamicibacter halophytocola TaxID=1933880 RepID=A0A5B8IXV1_9MICC|nr:MFS transporter [Glutamicibacter halophytocola]NQD39896.1 MFS transporter [Glutamicibacter halophytocola]QDY66800.1 MFS transporter [Glutamicibacter halophytocola]UUX58935.1 MFS transporter [Glutamicibacter halophytocola]
MNELTRSRVQQRTLWILAVSQIFGTIGVGVAPSIGILLAEEVTSSEAWAGLARTASTLGAALLGLPLGNLAARFGRRVALASGWWLAALGALLLVPAAQYQLVIPLFAGLLLIGSGSAISLQARFAATDLAADDHKGRSLALIVWVGTIGTVLGPNLGIPAQRISDATGLHVYAGAFLIAGVAMLVAGLLVFLLMRPDPLLLNRETDQLAGPALPVRHRGGLKRFAAELRNNPRARYAVVAILSAQMVMVAIMTMTPIHVTDHGGSVSLVGVTISLHILGMYALAPLVGYVADRWGYRFSIAVGLAIFAGSLLAGGLHPQNMGWIMTSLILLGVGWSFINVAGSALFATVISKQDRASVQGGVDALSNLCGATAAFAAGPLMAVSSFSALAAIAGIVLIPLVLMTTVTPKTAALKS